MLFGGYARLRSVSPRAFPSWLRFSLSGSLDWVFTQTALICSFSTSHLHLGGRLRRSIALRTTVVSRKRDGSPGVKNGCGSVIGPLGISDHQMLTSVTHTILSFVCLIAFRRLSAKSAKVGTERFFWKNTAHLGCIPQLAIFIRYQTHYLDVEGVSSRNVRPHSTRIQRVEE